ncbi:unnamed protein product [Symbiodinium natans]|uniref:Methyltransferase domain-containing protein n=1 Tax=Symbiodinium natans TaxID=878477 RepID=A0A812MCT5_9DINO|nr:unnamed protein product [Symbiodinium natans]
MVSQSSGEDHGRSALGAKSWPTPWTLAAVDECSDWERQTHSKSWNRAMKFALRHWSHNGTKTTKEVANQPSGPGSSLWATTPVRKFLRLNFNSLQIRSFLDVPCGDMTWMPEVNLTGVDYIGGDLSSALVASHLKRFADDPRFANKFAQFDITCMVPPPVDMIHTRDVLMHIDTDLSLKALKNFERSGSKYLVLPHWPFSNGSTNEYHPMKFEQAYQLVHDLDPQTSQVIGYHEYNLELPPYCFPPALYFIRNTAITEQNGYLGVWALPALRRGKRPECLANTPWLEKVCDSRFNCFDTLEERRSCLAGRSEPSSCCQALQLIQRLHKLDTGGFQLTRPKEVRALCLDFLRLPRGSVAAEKQLATCSRAVLAMAAFDNEGFSAKATSSSNLLSQ